MPFCRTKNAKINIEKMIEHQVIDILKSLSSDEVKQFRRFLASPYFIRSNTINSLFELLIKFHPNFDNKRLTKEFIYGKIFDTGKYNDSTFRNAFANLLDNLELFLMQESLKKSAESSFHYFLKELNSRKLSGVFNRNSEEFGKKFAKLENIDSDYYHIKYKHELNKFNFNYLNNKVLETEDADLHFKEIFDSGLYITIHYIIEIISIYLASVYYSLNFNRVIPENFLNTLIKTINIENLENIIKDNEHSFLVRIYIALLRAFNNMNDETYFEYKAIFKQHINKLSKSEVWFHYINLTNFCTLKIMNTNDRKFYDEELISLYEEILQNEYYKNKETDYLRFELYRDILLMYLHQKKINSAENFIIKYSSKLHKSDKANMINLSYAYLYYEKGEFMQSWKYFNKIHIDYFLYKYDIKSYALKIYYELGYYEEALTLIENYKGFLNRNELMSESEKKRKKNLILYLSKLILIKAGQIPYKQFATYRRRLEMAKDTTSRDWVIEKYELFANEIKQNRQLKSA